MNRFFKKVYQYINPTVNPDLESAFDEWQKHIPTLWLLGKTGAGKSTIIQTLTGDSLVEIGNGFQPCTRTAHHYLYPAENPLVCFLDTRGLGEADYDPTEDIAMCSGKSHALMVVMKAEEPEQSGLLTALKQIKRSGVIKHLLVIHTAVNSIVDPQERQRAIDYNHQRVMEVWGIKPAQWQSETATMYQPIVVDLIPDDEQFIGIDGLHHALTDALPMLSLLSNQQAHTNREEQNFYQLRQEVLWYAGAAGASDAIPAVGLFSVPAIQGKMLHSLANQYGVSWNKKDYAEFVGMLGSGFLLQYLSKLGLNQLVKFIPAYGQTVGSATAAAMSFSSTYAIGRAACMYLYHRSKGESISKDQIKLAYQQAFTTVKQVADRQQLGKSVPKKDNE
ncbi:kinase [Photobacterium phosphoreum]|uniref:YcjF family protein n=1 Tax=Photobacterium phosphoreum TaxID=659 RepID=UPI000D152874|nr:GTPase [Photobacterium phosphoreum]PSU70076.1 kinase [Photobacterium phosphoreum]PSW10656.1 kinase [Photobacterium phosphoreum]